MRVRVHGPDRGLTKCLKAYIKSDRSLVLHVKGLGGLRALGYEYAMSLSICRCTRLVNDERMYREERVHPARRMRMIRQL